MVPVRQKVAPWPRMAKWGRQVGAEGLINSLARVRLPAAPLTLYVAWQREAIRRASNPRGIGQRRLPPVQTPLSLPGQLAPLSAPLWCRPGWSEVARVHAFRPCQKCTDNFQEKQAQLVDTMNYVRTIFAWLDDWSNKKPRKDGNPTGAKNNQPVRPSAPW